MLPAIFWQQNRTFMSHVPTDLRAVRVEHILSISWSDGECRLPFAYLRRQCACAQCVNEWTGQQILDPSSVPDDITILKMDLVGSYAVRVEWSDGHNSGLYTWDRLRELCQNIGPRA
jgi:DUF971 family protein